MSMNFLSQRTMQHIVSTYRRMYALTPSFIWPSGRSLDQRTSPIDPSPAIRQARAHALQEAVRWGEAYSFFIAPGVISWVVPIVDRYTILGGVVGGEVLAESDSQDREEAAIHWIRQGMSAHVARSYVATLSAWPAARSRAAADHLFTLTYQVSSLSPLLLHEQRERREQQQQIAEEIHRRKQEGMRYSATDGEQVLLSLIRVGDKKGARRILNQMLGRVFLRSANLTVIRALMIEMMGYLVRRAVEDSPFLEPIMERNHQWMAKIIEAEDFETLAAVLRMSLDDFMDNVYALGYGTVHPGVTAALQYLNTHYREPVTLADVAAAAGLSHFRLAHVVKEQTGRTLIQHLHLLRIHEAKRLLEETEQPLVDIALDVGFSDQSYFTRQFRKYTGLTPSRHRRIAQPATPFTE